MKTLKHTKDSEKLVAFAMKYPDQWHSFADNYMTKKAIFRAIEMNEIEVNEFNQFKFKPLGI